MPDPGSILARLAGSSGPDLSVLAREDPFLAVERKTAKRELMDSDRGSNTPESNSPQPFSTHPRIDSTSVDSETTMGPLAGIDPAQLDKPANIRKAKRAALVTSRQFSRQKHRTPRQRRERRDTVEGQAALVQAPPVDDDAMSNDDFRAMLDPSLRRAILAEQPADISKQPELQLTVQDQERAHRLLAEDVPVMFMHHTLSEDLSGSQDSIISQRLARLGIRSRKPAHHKIREERFGFEAAAADSHGPGEREDYRSGHTVVGQKSPHNEAHAEAADKLQEKSKFMKSEKRRQYERPANPSDKDGIVPIFVKHYSDSKGGIAVLQKSYNSIDSRIKYEFLQTLGFPTSYRPGKTTKTVDLKWKKLGEPGPPNITAKFVVVEPTKGWQNIDGILGGAELSAYEDQVRGHEHLASLKSPHFRREQLERSKLSGRWT